MGTCPNVPGTTHVRLFIETYPGPSVTSYALFRPFCIALAARDLSKRFVGTFSPQMLQRPD